jgi:FkbM family methyltransferase
MGMRALEARFRNARVRWMKALMSSTRGRKLIVDALPSEVRAMTVDCGDHVLTVSPHEFIGRQVITRGDYTRDLVAEVIALLDRHGRLPDREACVLELGANIGTHTVYLALTGRFRRILAVEPDPRNLALLRRNIEDNDLEPLVEVFACAAGACEDTLVLHQVEGNFGQSSLLPGTAGEDDGVRVPVRTVAGIRKEAEVEASEITLIWMDVEGFEPQACRGMPALLSRATPIFLEFSPEFHARADQREFAALLARHYSRCVLFDRQGPRSVTFAHLGDLERQCDILVF